MRAHRAPSRAALDRLPLLIGAGLALLAGLCGGLARLGVDASAPSAFAAQHGPLMALGFLGTLISLERAVALARPWGYVAPALAMLGGLTLAAGRAEPLGRLLLTVAAAWLVAVYLVLLRRRPGLEVPVQLAGAVAWYAGGLLWLGGRPTADLVPWLVAFLVLTIAGERLELTRIVVLGPRPSAGLLAAAVALAAGTVAAVWSPAVGWRVAGVGMLGLTGWFAVYDVTRRTVRSRGLPRYTAWCLLCGYVWLAVAGAVWLAAGRPSGSYDFDAASHAVFLGFAMSMVFGHAPVILPAVLRIRLPYHPLLYAPLALLHGALTVRVTGDLAGAGAIRTAGGVGTGIALLAFAGCALAATRLRCPPRTGEEFS
ncbi:hypothetical protein TH66_19245 [Carbonactinospora thermoautotrophica]|uniref:Uncharacterized protein n=1 Tax=Carbonactinospora thermoautotrophica TaxID=1469144 RepID=A0A132MK70_9ACTN|nr:hypothetical protein TH66_19245 [Carbonactinospora thermoautotrophica]KWX03959.1 hypothetical protein TR74_24465 [Carbonactinospora thermoautotrophica]